MIELLPEDVICKITEFYMKVNICKYLLSVKNMVAPNVKLEFKEIDDIDLQIKANMEAFSVYSKKISNCTHIDKMLVKNLKYDKSKFNHSYKISQVFNLLRIEDSYTPNNMCSLCMLKKLELVGCTNNNNMDPSELFKLEGLNNLEYVKIVSSKIPTINNLQNLKTLVITPDYIDYNSSVTISNLPSIITLKITPYNLIYTSDVRFFPRLVNCENTIKIKNINCNVEIIILKYTAIKRPYSRSLHTRVVDIADIFESQDFPPIIKQMDVDSKIVPNVFHSLPNCVVENIHDAFFNVRTVTN